jgi:hypothetical protein
MFDYGDLAEAGAFSTPLTFEPVSRIVAAGFSTGRPAQVAVLGLDLLWDDEQEMIWDDEQNIGWEA